MHERLCSPVSLNCVLMQNMLSTQLVCNEDRVIKKDFVISLQGLRCLLLCCKMIFKKFDDLCANENGTVMKDPYFS